MLVLSVGVMVPFTNEAHGVRQTVEVGKKRNNSRYRSRAWWRRYRARLRQKRAAAELAHRNALLALPRHITVGDLSGASAPAIPSEPTTVSAETASLSPPVMATNPASNAVTNSAHANAATRPRVVNPAHPAFKAVSALPGQMNLAVVALSRPNPAFMTSREKSKMLGGLPVADLRRIVIDKMAASNGWVVNDLVREMNGVRVFVVTARTPKDALSPEKAWTFYFTEAGGRIYGLSTDAPVESADRMSTEAERFIETLRAKTESTSR
jgi:hypothetical protein